MTKPRKAIILAGGYGTRLYPLTLVVNKHLLPVYDKPMIYYPLSTLMLAGHRDIVVISTPQATPQFRQLLGDGSQWGVSIEYRVQHEPGGIAQCFSVAADLVEGYRVTLILGDNIFYGTGLQQHLERASAQDIGATIFGYEVSDPSAFGVVVLDANGTPIAIEEKPRVARSRLAVPGIYFYDSDVCAIAASLQPSTRGELEITDVNRAYLERGRLSVQRFGRGTAWLDGGSHRDLFEAGQFIKVIEERSGLKIAVPEEIAWRKGFIDDAQLERLFDQQPSSDYGRYLRALSTHGR